MLEPLSTEGRGGGSVSPSGCGGGRTIPRGRPGNPSRQLPRGQSFKSLNDASTVADEAPELHRPGLDSFTSSVQGRDRVNGARSPRKMSPGRIISTSLGQGILSAPNARNYQSSSTDSYMPGSTTMRMTEPALSDFDGSHKAGMDELVEDAKWRTSIEGEGEGEGEAGTGVDAQLKARLARVNELLATQGAVADGTEKLLSRMDGAQLSRAYLRKATLLNSLRRHPEAVAAAHEALRLDPSSAVACYRMGLALFCMSQMQDALACLHKASQLDPTSRAVRDAISVCVLRIKSRKERVGFYCGS